MIQNLKVDVIYHQTASDFEMEFNLCGCCRMRLLNDKTTDRKGFVKALARGVARSRVIIACGPLFGDEGIIKTVSIAIGTGLCSCDAKTYGIISDEKIEIIKGSTPLVTSDGYFGGCIIESGPQTIILLTENRAFRKAIMQNLIHPYIEELSYIPTKSAQPLASVPAVNDDTLKNTTQDTEYLVEVDTDYDEQSDIKAIEPEEQFNDTEHNIEFVMDEDESSQDEEEVVTEQSEVGSDNMYIEVEKPEEIKSRYEQSYTPAPEDEMFISSPQDTEDDEPRGKKSLIGVDISMVIFVLVLLMAVLALVYFIFLVPYTQGISTGEYLNQIFSVSSGQGV